MYSLPKGGLARLAPKIFDLGRVVSWFPYNTWSGVGGVSRAAGPAIVARAARLRAELDRNRDFFSSKPHLRAFVLDELWRLSPVLEKAKALEGMEVVGIGIEPPRS